MKALIASIVLVLGLVLFWQWRDWPAPDPGSSAQLPESAPAETAAEPAENPLDLLSPLGELEDYANVTERPLFLPDRRPPSEEEEKEEEAAAGPELPSDLARLDLNAVLITPTESSAWIRDPKKKELERVRLGDELEGWSVQEILSDRILLERQGEKDTLVLRDYKNMPPPPRRPTAIKAPQKTRQAAVQRRSPSTQAQRPNRSRTARAQQRTARPQQNSRLPRRVQNPRARTNVRQPFQQR